MKTKWDYTNLADSYLKRPEYSDKALKELFDYMEILNSKDKKICDIGAGVAHLTLELAKLGSSVYAIEPNDAMRNNGIKRTKHLKNVKWFEGVAENTNMQSDFFDVVTFGSSFNVTDRNLALIETSRILKSGGYFACMWNHRNLEDNIQNGIENIIKQNIPNYDYGTRREDQSKIINKSNLFEKVKFIEGDVIHRIDLDDFIEGFRSHATISRQSKENFNSIILKITDFLKNNCENYIDVPYTTRIWTAKVKK